MVVLTDRYLLLVDEKFHAKNRILVSDIKTLSFSPYNDDLMVVHSQPEVRFNLCRQIISFQLFWVRPISYNKYSTVVLIGFILAISVQNLLFSRIFSWLLDSYANKLVVYLLFTTCSVIKRFDTHFLNIITSRLSQELFFSKTKNQFLVYHFMELFEGSVILEAIHNRMT